MFQSTIRRFRALTAVVLGAVLCVPALAQTGGGGGGSGGGSAPLTYFMIINGRVNGNANISPRTGDRVAAVIEGGGVVEDQVDSSGEWDGLTITRSSNTPVTIRFEFRRGSARYALVPSAGATDQYTLEFLGVTNPLSAAFNAQNITTHIGPALSGGGGDGGGDGDGGGSGGGSPDVDGDGVVTMEDARLVMRWVIGYRRELEGASLDVNSDSRINTNDVTEILRRMGETVEAPTEGGDAGATP